MLLTLPNVLTLLRILAIPFFAIAVGYRHEWEACILFFAAGLTDMLDGWIARRFNKASALGAIMDPAADKLLMTTAFILLALPRTGPGYSIPAWVSILAISRDLIISLFALMAYDKVDRSLFRPTLLGKLNTCAEVGVISLVLLMNALGPRPWCPQVLPWLFRLVAVMVVASGLQYFFRATRHRTEHHA